MAWTTPTLTGRHVRLAPLEAAHAPALLDAAADGALWETVYTNIPGPGLDAAEAYIALAHAQRDVGTALPFVVEDAQGRVVGSTRFYDIDEAVPRAKIGYTWYAASAQRTGLNTEAKRLLLAHAFEALGCACVALETSHLNLRSQAAIARLGAKRDGVLRAHLRHKDGSLRDSVVFSILAGEWPAVRGRLDGLLQEHAS